MEAFSLLKYWRKGATDGNLTTKSTITVRQMATAVVEEECNTDEEEDDDGDEGPFFDLEFSVPDEEEETLNDEDSGDDDNIEIEEAEVESMVGEGTDGEPEFNFMVSPDSNGGDRVTSDSNNIIFSHSDDLFFKGRLVPLEESSSSLLLFNQSESNKPIPQFPVSLLKTATKFRVFMLGFKKTKSESSSNGGACSTSPEPASKPETQTQEQQRQHQKRSKFLEVKFKVEEVPIISLFTRDNSSKSSTNNINKQQSSSSDEANAESEGKKFSKDAIQKYLKMIKPLYVKASKKYGEKMGFSGQLSLGSEKTAPTSSMPISTTTQIDGEKTSGKTNVVRKSLKQGNLPGGFRVVRKHLGKIRSAPSAVASVTPVMCQAKRRDDSLLQQQDGIQSAILHCKRSFNASRESDCCDPLSRSTSNSSSKEKPVDASRACFDEVIEARI